MKKTFFASLALLAALGIFWKSTSVTPQQNINTNPKPNRLLEINSDDWVRGDKNAPVILVEYGDFQCPACGAYYSVLKQLEADYDQKLAVIWRGFPLTTIHANAWNAAVAAEAAGKQGKFWEMHDELFENQKEWAESGKFEDYAKKISLDIDKWKQDMKGVEEKIRADQNSGIDLGVTGTPTFFVNGAKIEIPGSLENFRKIIDGVEVVSPEKVHMHFDFAFYESGKRVDLSQDKYMEKNETVHLHDNNGEVAHIHEKGAKLGVFIESLGLAPEENPTVNGEIKAEWKNYEPQDLDRIVFGEGTVTDKACIYSEKCPERGTPPPEEGCVGGLDTPCE